MAQLGGFLNALGQAFSGYGQDQQIRFQREQAAAQLAMQQQGASDQHLDAILSRYTNYPLVGGSGNPSAPTMQTGMPPAPSPAPSGPPQTPLSPPSGPMIRRGDGFIAAPQPPTAPPSSPPTQPAASASPGILGQLPTDPVDVPGYGTIDRYGGLKKQLLMKQLESDIDTNAKVNVAGQTGETAKNAADTNLAQRNAAEIKPGDLGYIDYMSTLSGAQAMATLPADKQRMVAQGKISLSNALAEEDERAKNAGTLQTSQQTFDKGQQGRQQQFERGQQAGDYLNRSNEINQQQRDGPWGRLWAPSPATSAPSAQLRLTPEQIQRAARDPLYAKFLQTKSY